MKATQCIVLLTSSKRRIAASDNKNELTPAINQLLIDVPLVIHFIDRGHMNQLYKIKNNK